MSNDREILDIIYRYADGEITQLQFEQSLHNLGMGIHDAINVLRKKEFRDTLKVLICCIFLLAIIAGVIWLCLK